MKNIIYTCVIADFSADLTDSCVQSQCSKRARLRELSGYYGLIDSTPLPLSYI